MEETKKSPTLEKTLLTAMAMVMFYKMSAIILTKLTGTRINKPDHNSSSKHAIKTVSRLQSKQRIS